VLRDARLLVAQRLLEMADAHRPIRSDQRQELEANRVGKRPEDVDGDVTWFVDDVRRRDGLAVAEERQRPRDRPRVSRLGHCSQCKRGRRRRPRSLELVISWRA
jgi:hypothetical protein